MKRVNTHLNRIEKLSRETKWQKYDISFKFIKKMGC